MDDLFSKLRYVSTERVMQGVIVQVQEGAVSIDLDGRLGCLKIPMRMIISDEQIKEGQRVAFLMSYPEVVEDNE